MTSPGGFTVNGLSIAVYSPVRGRVDGETLSYSRPGRLLAAQTPAVRYDNRLSDDARVSSAAVAGWYYLPVACTPGRPCTSGGVPVTLRLRA